MESDNNTRIICMEKKLDELSSDALIHILHCMNIKDATRTSILSRKWRYLFNYHTCLDYIGFERENDPKGDELLNSVGRVLRFDRVSSIDVFRVRTKLSNNTDPSYMNECVEYAISKGVKTLELDFSVKCKSWMNLNNMYRLPCSIWKNGGYESQARLLRSLCLKCVNISDEFVELVVRKCSALEQLHVERSEAVNIIRVNSRSLKRLAIKDCFRLKVVEIDAQNLVSLEYNGSANVEYVCVPSLVEASFGWSYCNDRLIYNFWLIKSFSFQLSKLTLCCGRWENYEPIMHTLLNLKELELRVRSNRKYLFNYSTLACFFDNCPLLEKAKIEMDLHCNCREDWNDHEAEYSAEDVGRWLKVGNGFNATLPHLRELEWCGGFRSCFDWCTEFGSHFNEELMLALHIIKNATMLEKFIFDPHSPFRRRRHKTDDNVLLVEIAKDRALDLALVMPEHVELLILD